MLVAVDLSESMNTTDQHAAPAEKLRWARALGMIGKTIPQISFMSVGMTLRAFAGLAVVILGLGVSATVLGGALTDALRLAHGVGGAP